MKKGLYRRQQTTARKFEQCDKGTILLDEIGDMSLSTQAKILRVLQEGQFERIGGNETVKVDVRVLTSTNRKLEVLIKEGRFREDLYYRLKIMSVALPSLRERNEDIKELDRIFLSPLQPPTGHEGLAYRSLPFLRSWPPMIGRAMSGSWQIRSTGVSSSAKGTL